MVKTVTRYVFRYNDSRGGYYAYCGETRACYVEHRVVNLNSAKFYNVEDYIDGNDRNAFFNNTKEPPSNIPGDWVPVKITYEIVQENNNGD